jgi:hypothetical protein
MKQRVIHLPFDALKTSVRQALISLSKLELFELHESSHLQAESSDIIVDKQGVALVMEGGEQLRSSLGAFQLGLRSQSAKASDSNFARALKLHQGKDHLIWDMSVGLAQDLALMRHYGARRLIGFERHPSIFAMLSCDSHFLGLGVELHLFPQEHMERPEVIYFDPMYPQKKKKSAKSKKGMEVFKLIVGDDLDAQETLELLKEWAQSRVVVKRPPEAKPLALPVSFSYLSKTVRYDVYEKAKRQSPDPR